MSFRIRVHISLQSFFSLDFGLIKYGASFIVHVTVSLGVSTEKHHWRIRLLHFHLLADYWIVWNSTSIFFHGYLSLHLPFTWGFSINIPSDSYSKYMVWQLNLNLFHCYLLLHLPFKWGFSIKIQSSAGSDWIEMR